MDRVLVKASTTMARRTVTAIVNRVVATISLNMA